MHNFIVIKNKENQGMRLKSLKNQYLAIGKNYILNISNFIDNIRRRIYTTKHIKTLRNKNTEIKNCFLSREAEG